MGDREDGATMTPETAVMILDTDDPDRHSITLRARAAQVVAQLVERALPAPTLDATGPGGHPQTWRFVGYRPGLVVGETHDANQMNPPDAAQYVGVIWPDGTCTLRWLTAKRSTAGWDSFADAMDIHGHPEYGTRIVWLDKPPQEAVDKLAELANALAEKRAEEAELAEREAQLVEERVELSDNGRTLVVCLDCDGPPRLRTETGPLIVPMTERVDAESWLSVHLENNPGHRAVTVPGWPLGDDAIAIAREHTGATS
jgi:hypothetical protein